VWWIPPETISWPSLVRVYKVPMEPGDVGKTWAGAKSWKKSALIGIIILILCAAAFTAWHSYFRPPPIKPASIDKMAFPLPRATPSKRQISMRLNEETLPKAKV
jgi:hypothetical protein